MLEETHHHGVNEQLQHHCLWQREYPVFVMNFCVVFVIVKPKYLNPERIAQDGCYQ
jgi:hypothetical protein